MKLIVVLTFFVLAVGLSTAQKVQKKVEDNLKFNVVTIPGPDKPLNFTEEEKVNKEKELAPRADSKSNGSTPQSPNAGKGSTVKSQIVGGTVAATGEFPWMALVVSHDGVNFSPCGGSLIHNSWVLTAASCVTFAKVSINVHLGMQTRLHWSGSVTIGAISWVAHPNYNAINSNNDVGLIKLRTPAVETAYIRMVRLPRYSMTTLSYSGSEGCAIGWGSSVLGGVSGNLDASLSWSLQKVNLPIISNLVCLFYYRIGTIVDTTLCTSGKAGKSICTYDMGGPLLFKESDGLWTQIGVSSFVSAQGCTAQPAGFARVTSYLGWIGTTANIQIKT